MFLNGLALWFFLYQCFCQCMMIDKDDTEQPPPFCQSNIQNMADSLPFILGICWTQNRQVSVIIMLKPNIPSYIFYWRRSRAFVTLPRASSDQDLTNSHQFVDKLSSQIFLQTALQSTKSKSCNVSLFWFKLPAWKNRHQSLIVCSGEAVYFLSLCH